MAAIRRREQRLDRRPDRIDYLRARMMCRDLHRSSWASPGIKTGAPPDRWMVHSSVPIRASP